MDLLALHEKVKVLADNLKYFSLKNEMKVVLYQDKTRPKVLVQVAYDVGSSIETSPEKGLAHLVEHMIFKGTTFMTEGDIDAISRKYGASYNAYTSNDVTSYYFETNKNNWTYFLQILADCMQNSRFDKEHLASELKAVVQELNLSKDDNTDKILEKICTILFPSNHPYHFPVIGFKEELANLKIEQLQKFYKKYYHPSKAVLFVCGDFDFDQAEELVKKLFEHIPNPDQVFTPVFPPILQRIESSSYVFFEDIEQEKLFYFWQIPGVDQINTALVDVFYDVIAGGQNNRLYKILVDEKQVAKAVDLNIYSFNFAGIVMLAITPAVDDYELIKQAIEEEFNHIREKGFFEDEINRSKMGLAASFVKKTENWSSLIYDWIFEVFLSGHPVKAFDYLQSLHQVSNESLLGFFNQNFFAGCNSEVFLKKLSKKQQPLWEQNQLIIKEQENNILKNHVRTTPLEEAKLVKTLPDPSFFDYSFPKPDKDVVLDCGINFLSYHKSNYPICYFKLVFKNSQLLSKSKEGLLVDLMMQLLLEKNLSYEKYDSLDYLDMLGAHYSFDYEGIALSCLAQTFKPALQRILKIYCEPQFEKDLIERQKSILIADLLERAEDPQKIAFKKFYQHLYEDEEFNWSFKDAIKYVESITLHDLKACHKKYLNPASFIVCLAGADQAENTISALEEHFSEQKQTEFVVTDPVTVEEKIVLQEKMLRDQTTILLARKNSLKLTNPDYLALSVLNIIVFYGLGSKMYQLREQQGLFYSIFGGIALDADQFGSMDYICTVVNPMLAEHTKNEILRVLDEVCANGVLDDELLAAKQIYLGSTINLFSDVYGVCQVIIALKQKELSFDFYDQLLNQLKSLSVVQINDVAKKYYQNKEFCELFVGSIN